MRARLECDLAVSRWYVACLDCGAAGPTAESDQAARDGWAEMVEFIEALAVWNGINTIRVDADGPLPDCRTSAAALDSSRGAANPRDAWPPGRVNSPTRPVPAHAAAGEVAQP